MNRNKVTRNILEEKPSSLQSRRNILSAEQVQKMSEVGESTLESLLPSLLFELGLRGYEAENLDTSDLTERGDYWEISVDYRDGERNLILAESVPELEAWLKDHPDSGENSPLLVRNGERITSREINFILRKLGAKAEESSKKLFGENIRPKKLVTHDFRVSCVKKKCENFSTSYLQYWFGWTTRSSAERYQKEFNNTPREG